MSSSKYHKRRQRKPKSKIKWIIMAVALLAVVAVVVVITMSNEPAPNENLTSNQVMLQTSLGNILIELRDDMPITTANFKNLVEDGVYDNTIFHRIINSPNDLVMIQGGDPTGTGYGDSSIPNIADEFSDDSENNKNVRGTIAMANKGQPNTGSSQFFINGEYNSHLDNIHPVFGDVIEGMDVVDQILNVDTNSDGRPLTDVVLISAYLVQET